MLIVPGESSTPSCEEKENKRNRGKYNNVIHQEINVLLIMFKTVYDKANSAPFHQNEYKGGVSRERNLIL